MNNFASRNKFQIDTLTVGTSNAFTPSIETTGFERLMFAFRAKTFAGTPDTADYVKIVKFQGSNTNAFGGEEVDIAGIYDFEKSDASSTVNGLAQLSVQNSTQIKKTTLADYAMQYKYIRACFISSDAANTVAYVFELTNAKSAPIDQ
jgi:hypothetical protein